LGDDERFVADACIRRMRRGLLAAGAERRKAAIEQTSGDNGINIHGAIDLETGQKPG